MARLNDTEALRREPLREGTKTTSVRKINGGHIVSEHTFGQGYGEGQMSERFVPAGEKTCGTSSLRDAMDYTKGKR